MEHTMLVSADWLAARLDDPNVRPVDVRWYLTEPERGYQEYLAGHIPGAPYMSLDRDMAKPAYQGPGRHPLPAPEAFAEAAGRAGVGAETLVVAYDSQGGAYAARLWWLLRYFGHERVALLDGGWGAWTAGGHPAAQGETTVAPASFTARPRPELVVGADAVEELRHRAEALLIDARAAERYEGRVEPMDKRAGHIPGARSLPFAQNLRPDGTFKSPEELRAQYEALGAGGAAQVVCYCGSGVTAAHNLFALRLAGRGDALLYEGSWSDWSSDPQRPVATGAEPGLEV